MESTVKGYDYEEVLGRMFMGFMMHEQYSTFRKLVEEHSSGHLSQEIYGWLFDQEIFDYDNKAERAEADGFADSIAAYILDRVEIGSLVIPKHEFALR